MEKPILIEPGIKTFLNHTLQGCHKIRVGYNNFLYNCILATLLFLAIAVILIMKYKGKMTPAEKKQNELIKKQYILSRIQNFQESKEKMQQQLITGLPAWV